MSLDKLIAAATDYFTTGADVHRRALNGGGGKITDLSEKPAETKPAKAAMTKAKEPEVTDVVAKSEPVPQAKVTKVVEKQPAPTVVEEPEDDLDGPAAPSYEEDIRPLVRSKSLSNRNGVIALLGSFGVKAGSELTTAQHAAFFAGLKAL